MQIDCALPTQVIDDVSNNSETESRPKFFPSKANSIKEVIYERSSPWVGVMQCPECGHSTPAWRSSGMSDCFPHFYCDRCSNVIHRTCDQDLVWESKTPELLDRIAATLPNCPCGGRFGPDNNPKCAHCNAQFKHKKDAVTRLHDRHMIAVDGACVFTHNEPYRVRIVG